MTDIVPKGMNRRGFLGKVIGLVSVAAAAVMVKPTGAQEKRVVTNKQRAGYRETEHVRQFYRNARF